MEEYTREKLVKVRSLRLIEELFVFVYNNVSSKIEAMRGYNDDLVISYCIALWIRDTALRLRKEGNELQRSMMDSMLNSNGRDEEKPIYFGRYGQSKNNPWEMDVGNEKEDLTWLL